MDVEFCDLSYSVKKSFYFSGENKTILRSLNGKFQSGHLTVILGSSGAGKTSLLHVLSGYKTSGIQGELLVNGQVRNESWFRRRSCYITQEDRLPAFMTVDEAMRMVARLKLKENKKAGEIVISEILLYLGLENVRDVKTDRLSGGQQKRLSIALELMSNPPVFFLDEPTSGLDDVNAKNTIRLMRRLAEEGRTVVCTMHQPSASMLRLFHRIYVVSKGQCVFQGTPERIVPFLAKYGYECPTSYNPADYLIEIIENDETIKTLSTAIENGKVSEDYFDPTIMTLDDPNIQDVISSDIVVKTKKADLILEESSWIKLKEGFVDGDAAYAVSSWMQFWILYQRFFAQGLRNRRALLVQFAYYLGLGVLFGSCYYNNGNNGNMMYNHLKFYVGVTIFASFSRLFIPIILFPGEIRATKKEHFNRWYSIFPYFMATMLATIPFQIFFNVCFMSIIYYLVGLPNELWRYVMYNVCLILTAFSTEGVGIAIGATFNEQNGSVIGPAVTGPFMGLAVYGFDFAKHIPTFMQLIMRLSPLRCGLATFIIITFGFDRKPLHCDQIYCHFSDPKLLLGFLDGKNEQIYTEISALVISIIVFRILAYLCLRKRFST